MTPDLAQTFPEELRQFGDALPDILLPYQKEGLRATASHQLVIWEKSRRIGATWGIAADAVLTSGAARSAGGMDVMYIGYNLDMAREFIDTCAMWAKAFLPALKDVEEFLFNDGKEGSEDRYIQAFRISFASGFEIVALTSKPRSLRGRQGYLIFDEAAFHDDLAGMLKAAMAFLIWGGKVLVISTHDGDTNEFNLLIKDVRAKRRPGKVIKTTFDQAVEDGLYDRVKMMLEARGQTIPEKEKWVQSTYAFYDKDADEELRCVPSQGAGTVLSSTLIEMRMEEEIPVLRWEADKDYVLTPLHIREGDAKDWCEENLRDLLDALDPKLMSYFGMDFGRTIDLSVIWPVQLQRNLVRRPPFVVELGRIPFEQQKQVLFYIADRLPKLMAGAIDSGGNGASTGEAAADKYGHSRVHQVKFSETWYLENMPPFIGAFEDGLMRLPRDADILADHRTLARINGVIRVPAVRAADEKSKTGKRHGDSAIAHALAHFASCSDAGPFEYHQVNQRRDSTEPGRDFAALGDFTDSGAYFNM